MLRARDRDYLRDEIVPKVRAIAEGAATMTGAELTVEDFYPLYENVIPNNTLSAAVMGHAEAAGIRIDAPPEQWWWWWRLDRLRERQPGNAFLCDVIRGQ